MKEKIKIITLRQLRSLQNSEEDFVLVNVLNRENFEESYIPKSIHVSFNSEDFEKKFQHIIPNKNRAIG